VRLDRPVAIKEIREIFNVFAGVQKADILERFRSIVTTQASLMHPNIIQLIDLDTSGEYPYSVMQFAPNGNLRRVIDHGERPPLEVSLKYFLQILHGLNTAHDQGVVHGSLKPENVVLDQAGNALLTDFGIARIVERDGSRGNQVYVGVGSVAYMSPEQFQDPNLATIKSDIYSLGIMLYEMLTGKVPGRRSPMPSSFFPDIPRALDDIFDKMCMDREEDRYASIDAVITDIYSESTVLSILDKRSGVLFLRDPIEHGSTGLGADVAFEPLPEPDEVEEAVEESEVSDPSWDDDGESEVDDDGEASEETEEGDGNVLEKLDKYGELLEES
jgi:eukaryotic-like serine/threonine-protein kinase